MKKSFLAISVIVIVLVAVGVGYVLFSQLAAPSEGGPYGPPSTEGEIVRYTTASFVDTEGIGTKAFTMLVPSGWKSGGRIKWILDNPAMPVAGEFRA